MQSRDELIRLVRAYLKDQSVKNRIIGNEFEYLDEDIITASDITILEINERGVYRMHHTFETAPKYLLLIGTAARTLGSQIHLKARNYIPYTDGGSATNREGNLQVYQQLYSQMYSDYIDQLEMYKGKANIMSGF